MISRLLSHSSLREDEYVPYDLELLRYRESVFRGCRSRDFSEKWQIITLERLLEQSYGMGMNQIVYAIDDHQERLHVLCDLVERVTGLSFGAYMSRVLTIDTFFLNEDRHAHNLGILINDRKEYRLCPCFDHGAALLSDTTLDYPMGTDPIRMIKTAKPKTFCEDFDEQLDIAEELYGQHIRFHFDYSTVKSIMDQADIYDKAVRDRVLTIIMYQQRKYSYLFH